MKNKLTKEQERLLKKLMINSARKGNLANSGIVLEGGKIIASSESLSLSFGLLRMSKHAFANCPGLLTKAPLTLSFIIPLYTSSETATTGKPLAKASRITMP